MKLLKWLLLVTWVAGISGTVGYYGTRTYLRAENIKDIEKEIQSQPQTDYAFDAPCNTCAYVNKGIGYSYKTNPILNVSIYKDSKLVSSYQAVSGRWHTQLLDRNISGNESPSPNGEYKILDETLGYHPETGGVFLPYEPLFETQRSHLGFHIDPSWGLEGEDKDGTKGCIAFKTKKDYNSFVKFITDSNISKLIINYE